MASTLPDLSLLNGVVAQEVLDAMKSASGQLTKLGVRHALVGALAVGAWGYPRASKDVDFLVGDEAFRHHEGGLVSMAPGFPLIAGGVAVDPLSGMPGENHLEEALRKPLVSHGIPIAPLEVLVYLKLKSPRRKDSADVVELLKAGADPRPVRDYLRRFAADLLGKFEGLVSDACREESE